MPNSLSAASASLPIGVFDSGVGGISVLKHLQQRLPYEHFVYVADSLNAPYGNKSPDFIRQRSQRITEFLLTLPVKAIVVACNTATAAAVSDLRKAFSPLPIVAMEPAIKPAVAVTKTGVIGVMATSGTLQSAQFAALLEHYGQGVNVVTQACHGLVECIERGEITQPATQQLLQQYLSPLLQAGADTIVLGCTHYPFVTEQIRHIVGSQIALIDTGEAVARQLQHMLAEYDLLNQTQQPAQCVFYSNSAQDNYAQVIGHLWGKPVQVARLPV
jgi:glutamate racemase